MILSTEQIVARMLTRCGIAKNNHELRTLHKAWAAITALDGSYETFFSLVCHCAGTCIEHGPGSQTATGGVHVEWKNGEFKIFITGHYYFSPLEPSKAPR